MHFYSEVVAESAHTPHPTHKCRYMYDRIGIWKLLRGAKHSSTFICNQISSSRSFCFVPALREGHIMMIRATILCNWSQLAGRLPWQDLIELKWTTELSKTILSWLLSKNNIMRHTTLLPQPWTTSVLGRRHRRKYGKGGAIKPGWRGKLTNKLE